jgi:hypothetical protein
LGWEFHRLGRLLFDALLSKSVNNEKEIDGEIFKIRTRISPTLFNSIMNLFLFSIIHFAVLDQLININFSTSKLLRVADDKAGV